MADVAQLAGVGTMTVSRALRTPEQVSDKLREKIEAAVSELGYLPNLAASSLASASSYTIAMVVPSLSESGCAEMFAGLQKVLQPAGYHIMLAESQHHLEREEKLLETLLSYNLAAAVLLSVEHSQNARNALIAPPPKTIKPRIVFTVPFTTSENDFFCASKPISAISPTSTEGTFNISTTNLSVSWINISTSPIVLFR